MTQFLGLFLLTFVVISTAAGWGVDVMPHDFVDEALPGRMMRRGASLVQDKETEASHQHDESPANFRSYKFEVKKTRSGSGPAGYSEFALFDGNSQKIPLAQSDQTEVALFSTHGTTADAASVTDGNVKTGVLVQPGDFLIVKLLHGQAVGAFEFKTSGVDDSAPSDPTNFVFSGSNDETHWTVLSEIVDYLPHDDRGLEVGPFIVSTSFLAPAPEATVGGQIQHAVVSAPADVKYDASSQSPPAPPTPCPGPVSAPAATGEWVSVYKPASRTKTTTTTTTTTTITTTTKYISTTTAAATPKTTPKPCPSPPPKKPECLDNATTKHCVYEAVIAAANTTNMADTLSLQTAEAASSQAFLLRAAIVDEADDASAWQQELMAAASAAGMTSVQQANIMSAVKTVSADLEVPVLDALWAAHQNSSAFLSTRKSHAKGLERRVAAVVKAAADAGMSGKQQASAAYKATIAAAKFYQHYEDHSQGGLSLRFDEVQKLVREAQLSPQPGQGISTLKDLARAGFAACLSSSQIEEVVHAVYPLKSIEQEKVTMAFKAAASPTSCFTSH